VEVPAFAEGEVPVSAVVQILVEGMVEGYIEEWSGSGTIISPDGLILTNAHVAVGDRFYRADRLTIALTVAEDKPPVPAYMAEVVQSDAGMDIAVIRIAYDLSGQRIDPSSLDLPFVQLGNSDDLRLGDPISILGYPGIGGDTITLTSGEVSGFTSQAGYGNRAFIKTSATIAGGNSGGLATDADYKIIGIPTQVGAGEITGDIVDCRPLADTNRDGLINQYDTCIPTGGFINALRPINLAIPLINAAVEGKEGFAVAELPEVELPTGGSIIYQDDFSDTDTGWPVEKKSDESYFFKSGRYYIVVEGANNIRPITGGEILSDVVIQLDARVERSSGTGDFGVVCRYQDGNNMYMFEITQDAYYAVYKMVNGEWYPLIDYTYSDMLEGLTDARFNVTCIGNTFTFAVNGKLLGEVNDQSIASGDYGFFAGTFDETGNTISFDKYYHMDYSVEITSLVYEGFGFGRLPDGKAVFVPGVLPGEMVRIRIKEEKKRHAYGELLEVLKPSEDRISPLCQHFSTCGGCHYQHIPYHQQLEYKSKIFVEQLQRMGGIEDPTLYKMIPCEQEWKYRNNLQFHVLGNGDLAFMDRAKAHPFKVEECHLPMDEITKIWPLLSSGGMSAFKRVEVRQNETGEVLLKMESAQPDLPEMEIAASISVVHVYGDDQVVIAGDEKLVMTVLGREFSCSASSFFQTNFSSAEKLVQTVLEMAEGLSGTLMDLYSGVGLFSSFLADKFDQIIAVEASPSACVDFSINLDPYDHVSLYQSPVEKALPKIDSSPHCVVIDPPRKGMHRYAMDALLEKKPPTIIYVSCNPSTLARDLKKLIAFGYELQRSVGIDMFPQTFHIESVNLLTLG